MLLIIKGVGVEKVKGSVDFAFNPLKVITISKVLPVIKVLGGVIKVNCKLEIILTLGIQQSPILTTKLGSPFYNENPVPLTVTKSNPLEEIIVGLKFVITRGIIIFATLVSFIKQPNYGIKTLY